MARISGVNLPLKKQVHIALQYIYGIGDHYAEKICKELKIEKISSTYSNNLQKMCKVMLCIFNYLEISGTVL